MNFSIKDFVHKCGKSVVFYKNFISALLLLKLHRIVYSLYLTLKCSTIHVRGGSRTAATSKMERFVIIVNG